MGVDGFAGRSWFIALYIGLLLVFLVVYPIIVRANGLSVRQYFSGVWPALQLGFVSRSSMGSMPMTQTVAGERNLGVPRAYASFAGSAGCDHQDGWLRFGLPGSCRNLCSSVLRYSAGLHPVPADCDGVRARLSATAGTEPRAIVMLTLTLSTLGLPLDGVGLLLAIDPIGDMGRTALNVAGQALVPAIVARREGILDEGLPATLPVLRAASWLRNSTMSASPVRRRASARGGGDGTPLI